MVDLKHTTSPQDAMEGYYLLAATLRGSGIPADELGQLEKNWLQRRDIPATLYPYVRAAFIAGFTGQRMPEMIKAA